MWLSACLCLAASMCASIHASIRASICASVRAFACPCNCLPAACLCLCLGISLYCSSLLHTPQATLPLPSSSETVQPPNDPNNHTHRPLSFSASVFHKTTRPMASTIQSAFTTKMKSRQENSKDVIVGKTSCNLIVELCQIQNHPPSSNDPSKSLGGGRGSWCVYVGQDVPDYQAITGYS